MDISRLDAQTVAQRLVVDLRTTEGDSLPVHVDVKYDPRDPYAVTCSFHLAGGPVLWTFGRDLLSEGLCEPTGDGDVHVWPCVNDQGYAVVSVELCSPHGDALVEVRFADAVDFVDRMHALVAPGDEHTNVDLDAAIRAILDAEQA